MKNYTSSVPAIDSMALIEKSLVKFGASMVSKAYDDEGKIVGFYFQFIFDGRPISYRLPVRVQAVYDALERKYVHPEKVDKEHLWAQAERTAWKILYDWVLIQLSMIEMEQAQAMEIFLPYALMPGRDQTVFEKFRETGFKQLGPPKQGEKDE